MISSQDNVDQYCQALHFVHSIVLIEKSHKFEESSGDSAGGKLERFTYRLRNYDDYGCYSTSEDFYTSNQDELIGAMLKLYCNFKFSL